MLEEFKDNIQTDLTRLLACFERLKPGSTLQLASSAVMDVQPAHPVSHCPVAEVDTDIDTLKAQGVDYFVDLRDGLIHTRDGDTWTTQVYGGTETYLRPGTLCRSHWSGKLYYCDPYMRLTPINITD